MNIGIAGINGRMGQLLVEAARVAGHAVVGGTDQRPIANADIPSMTIAELASAADTVIDFTHATAVIPHAHALAAAGTRWILGTTGLSAANDAAVAEASSRIAIVQAANFGPGITLLLALARQLGAALPAEQYDAEILDMHHRQKVDAPSGTALALGRAVAEGRGVRLDDVKNSGRDGHTGARAPGEIGFAALRGGQIVGEHALLFTAAGEQITLTHRAIDRSAFAAGAIRAAEWAQTRDPGRYDMEHVMGLRRAS